MATQSTLPTGARYIDNIDYTKLKYLVDGRVIDLNSTSEADFNQTTGKPLTNITFNNHVDNFFLDTTTTTVKEKTNINNDLVYKYPKLLEVDSIRDMHVTDETTINAVFISEGASMKNMFGYYMYTLDENGNKRLLGNDSTNTDGYHYDPTVVFPHIYSDPKDSQSLTCGDSRRLIGNLPNGNFNNIYIGLFLIPHGWFAYTMKSPIDNKAILYSTIEFNTAFKALENSEYVTVQEKIYSVYFKSMTETGHELLLVGFEDVFVNGIDDLDYNDCIVGFEISDVNNIVDYNNYTTIEVDPEDIHLETKNNIIYVDEDGEYFKPNTKVWKVDTKYDHVFVRQMVFLNNSDRDELYNVYNNSNMNYKISFSKFNTNDGKFILEFRHRFRPADLKVVYDSEDDEEEEDKKKKKKVMYLYESKYNINNDDVLDKYKIIIAKSLNDADYTERYNFYQERNRKDIIKFTDVIDKPQFESTTKFRIIGDGIMDCTNGKSRIPSQRKQIYQVYKNVTKSNKGIIINVKMDDHPTDFMLGKKNFMRYVSFNSNRSEVAIIDLANMDIYKEVNGILHNALPSEFTNIKISDIVRTDGNVKDLINIFRSDSGAYYRTVTINNIMSFYCIRLPNVKNNPTMVFLDDSKYLRWNDTYNILGGTYYKKQTLYLVNNFSS